MYEKKTFKDIPIEGAYYTFTVTNNLHTSLKMKTYPDTKVVNIPYLKVYVNADTLYSKVTLDKLDSTYIVYINKGFNNIDSIKFTSDTNLVMASAKLSNMDLLNNPTIKVNGLTNVNGIYKILISTPIPPVTNPLVAEWRFENNGNDVMNKYPATLTHPDYMYGNTNPPEGSYYMNVNNSGCYADAGVIPLGNEFSICLWFYGGNEQTDARSVLGNTQMFYPDGFVLYIDELLKTVKFITSDGTDAHRTSIISNDAVWTKSTWTHVVITGSRTTGTGKCYINSIDKTRSSSTGVFKTFKTTTNFYIGKTADGSQMWGWIDDVRIYNKVLTQDEVTKVYQKKNL
jgi:hypothetical protein